MKSTSDEATEAPGPVSTGPETETTAEPRVKMSALLHRPSDVRSVALTGLFILALFYTMYFIRAVLLPLVLALLLSYLFRPLVRALDRVGIRPAFSAALLLLAVVGTLAYGVSTLATPVAGWLEKAPYGMQQLKEKLLPLKKPMQQMAQASGEIQKLTQPEPPPDAAPGPVTVPAAAAPAPVQVQVQPAGQTDLTTSIYTRTPEFIVSTVLLFILLYFLLVYDEVFLAKVLKLMPKLKDKKRAVAIAHDIESHVSRYLLTITVINICLGIAVGTAVGMLGLRNPIMWGVMVALLNFIPYLGALVGILCMAIGAVLSFDSLSYAMIFPATYLVLTSIEGQLITPLVMGRSLTLNPVIILLSLTFWGWMWGIAGVILAVPILAAFKIFCSHIEELEPIAEFLS